jgi:predicted Zn-dependent peptidase
VLRPRLADEDVEAARKEMTDLQARRLASSRNRAVDALEAALAPGHPLTRPVLGTADSLRGITAADLRAFHGDYVTGKRAVVTVVSPVPAEEVLEVLGAAFAGIPEGTAPPMVPAVPVTPPPAAELRAGKLGEQATIAMGYVFDAPPSDRGALAVAGALLSDALAFDLRETRGLAYSIGASIAPWGGRMRLLVTMGTRQATVDEAVAALRKGIGEFVPGDAAAVERAAAGMRGRLLMRRLTRINQAYFLGMEALAGEAPGAELARLQALRGIDRDRVAAAARRYLDAARCVVVVE